MKDYVFVTEMCDYVLNKEESILFPCKDWTFVLMLYKQMDLETWRLELQQLVN